ncbi:MAG: HAMP domain-containing sensor histidine kinase [Gemmatimonadota bacterium]
MSDQSRIPLPRLTVRRQLLFALFAVALLLAGPAVYSIGRLQTVRDIAVELHDRHAASRVAVGELRAALAEADRLQRSYIVTGDSTTRMQMLEALAETRASYRRSAAPEYGVSDLSIGLILNELDVAAYRIDELIQSGDATEATEYFSEIRHLYGDADAAVGVMARAIDRESAQATVRAETIASAAINSALIALGGSLAIALILGFGMTQLVTRPIERLTQAMSRVAEGEFDVGSPIEVGRRDELGDLARSFESMTAQLAELNRLKAEFVSKTSHNLKTPINVIGGYAEMLDEGLYGELEGKQAEAVQGIRDQVEALETQVRQLVDLSRMEAHAFTLQVHQVYLADLLLGVQRSFEALAKQRDIHFEISSDPSAPATIFGDEDRLRNEVLGNLLANAFKFTEAGGRVSVHASGSPDGLVIEVSDTGLGIEAKNLERIFDRYFQTGNGKRAAGSGLGLAIAKEVVSRHGGEVTVSSAEGEGATFQVILPVAKDDSAHDPA